MMNERVKTIYSRNEIRIVEAVLYCSYQIDGNRTVPGKLESNKRSEHLHPPGVTLNCSLTRGAFFQ